MSVSLWDGLILGKRELWWPGGSRQDGPAQLHQVYTVKLHLLLSWSHPGADLQQTELMRNIHFEIYCPSCQKKIKRNLAYSIYRKKQPATTYGAGYLLQWQYESKLKWFPIRDATASAAVQEISPSPAPQRVRPHS